MVAKIDLVRYVAAGDLVGTPRQEIWPLVVQARGTNMPDEIFVYQIVNDPALPGDRFTCVASVLQLFEIPKHQGVAIDKITGIPYYRAAQVELVCHSAEEADRIWTRIQKEVQSLVNNANLVQNVQGTVTASISQDLTSVASLEMNPPTLIQLSYQPAGTATYTDGVQGITSPDITLPGWLPVSAAPSSWVPPSGAFLFYNLELDTDLQAYWPPKTPWSGNLLHRKGVMQPYGKVWAITKDTLWWLTYAPINLPGYQRISPQPADSNAPWPTDYVNPNNPGSVTPQLTLTLFQ